MHALIKRLALVLVFVVPAFAQQATITGVTTDGLLTWTDDTTNSYSGVEWTVNLSDGWVQFGGDGWQIRSTSIVKRLQIDLWGQLGLDEAADTLSAQWPGYAQRRQGHFFRIASSSTLLPPSIVTNIVVLENVSAAAIHNIRVNANPNLGTTIVLTNIPSLSPSEMTPDQAIVGQHPWLAGFDWSDVLHPVLTNAPGWFVTWEQDGTNRYCGTTLVPVGSSDLPHRVTVTVYGNRVETYYDWLGPGGTVFY